jgi:hypothetical protein
MAKCRDDKRNMASRRGFLKMLGWTGIGSMGAGSVLSGADLFTARASPRPSQVSFAFEEVSASASGISWVHVNGRSAMAHLPETVGAGCAFLDYDNDGWMDIYLVNSGRCDFYEPPQPLRNALITTTATELSPT